MIILNELTTALSSVGGYSFADGFTNEYLASPSHNLTIISLN